MSYFLLKAVALFKKSEHKPVSPVAVANYLLAKGSPLDQRKLMKLVYICHGWYLGVFKKSLIGRYKVQAWKGSPVIPYLHRVINDSMHVKGLDSHLPVPTLEESPLKDKYMKTLSRLQKRMADEVFRVYGSFSGEDLSKMTHLKDTPWSEVWFKSPNKNALIPNRLIQKHYEEKLNAFK